MTGAPLVYSVVLTFNNFTDTDECLASLVAQSYAGQRLLVVDNASEDGSFEALKSKWEKDATFLCNKSNLGVAAGFNVGISHALDAGADFVVLFNNDLVADRALVARLVEAADQPFTAALTCLITYYAAPETIWFGRTIYSRMFGYTRQVYRGKKTSRQRLWSGLRVSDYVPFCAALLSREAIRVVGLLDEDFFISHEDVEWGLRARKSGLRCFVVGEKLVRHKVSATIGLRGRVGPGTRQAYFLGRNTFLVGSKHCRGAAAFTFLLGQGVCVAVNSLQFFLTGGRTVVRSYLKGASEGLRLMLATH